MIKDIIRKSKNQAGLSQAIARVILGLSFLGITLIFHQYDEYKINPYIAVFYLLFAFVSLGIENLLPHSTFKRKLLNIFVDVGTSNLVIFTSGLSASFVYPVLLWIIVGNGIRFGAKYLYISLFTAVTLFTVATQLNPIWNEHKIFSFSMTIGLVVLTMFCSTLIKKIHNLNQNLEKKVKDRTNELKHRLYHDQLTKLKNRTALKHDLENETFSMLFLIDIDKFTDYNDLYGTDTGNIVLLETVNYLQSLCSDQMVELYRIYGDGFILRIKDTQNNLVIDKLSMQIVDKLLQNTTISMQIPNIDDRLSVDYTVVAVDQKENALEKADMGLKYARSHNKNFVTFQNDMDTKQEIEKTLYWKHEIKAAIKEDRILPVFQPIVDKNGSIIKYESLMRMQQDDKLISPFMFLDIAKRTNLYPKLTMIMVEKCFSFIQNQEKPVSINLTFTDINNELFVCKLFQKIEEYKIGEKLIIELVESEAIEDFIVVQTFVNNIKKLGVCIAIDDFGSGYSNYEHILKIKPDFIKIDGSLIKNIDVDADARNLVESIVFLAHKLNIKTIAEFVHSKEVFEVCTNLRIDSFQGYYFYEPLSQIQIETLQTQVA